MVYQIGDFRYEAREINGKWAYWYPKDGNWLPCNITAWIVSA
jgi:hypothetical protein